MITTVTTNDPKAINTSLFSLEKQIENEIQTLRNTVSSMNKAISKINASDKVYTVNDKTGFVELTASDVGALPDTTVIPSRTSQLTNDSNYMTNTDVANAYVPLSRTVNDKALTTDITLSASDVGAVATTEKGEASGVATLDEYGKVPASQLPSAVMQYKGAWDASTNTPTLADGMEGAEQGDVYVCSVAGTVDLGSGSITFYEGDWVMYNGSVWERSANANLVKSVNGKQGVVSLTASDIPMPTGYIYYQIYNPTAKAWEASPETMFPLNTWEEITSDFSAYPFFKVGSTTTGSGHNASHSHTIGHTHTMAHTHSIDHTHSNGTTANTTIFASGSGNSYNGVGGKTFGTDSRTVTIPKYTGSSGAASNSTTSQPSSTSSGSSGSYADSSHNYPEPNYSGMKVWRCTGLAS